MAILPPKVSAETFAEAIRKFRAVVGTEWVFTEDEDVRLYRDSYSPLWGEKDEKLASAAVAPISADEVAAIVRIANEHGIPLYPISTGMNLGYGGSAPVLSGSVVVDLKRMNKIIEIDDVRGYAIVEPGVSYFDLYRYIQDHGLNVWIDTPDPGWGSVIGNALDHGVGYTYGSYRDHFYSHSGMEVVIPTGEIVRTGMGALPGAKSWGEYHYGFGPYVDGLFSQGNAGIVTKMGIHLMPAPEAYLSCMARVPRRRDIIPLVTEVNRLEHAGLIGMPNYGSPWSSSRDPALQALIARPGGWNAADIDRFVVDKGVPYWEVNLQFYGPEATNASNWEYAKAKITAAARGATFEEVERLRFPLTEEQKHNARHRVAIGVPNLEIFFIGARSEFNPTPSDGHVWFSPVIPKSGESILDFQETMSKAVRDAGGFPGGLGGYGPFSGPATWMYRTFIMITGLPVIRNNPEFNKRTRNLFERLIEVAAQKGWGEYRTHPLFYDKIMGTYSFNDSALLRFHERIKDAIDPNGIIAAGRSGIWPKYLRGA
jgi:4-cresol dehydrogenase (hydroxylating)